MGPTASGKTTLAIELAARLPIEVISVDSAMVYRGMDIGTGKPDRDTLARTPHRLVDIRTPDQVYSAAEFRRDALQAITEARDRDRVPLLVGGTGLYFRALKLGLSKLPSADPQVRERLLREAADHGWSTLHQRLGVLDPKAAERIHPNDPQRIQRALEVYELTGRPMSASFEDPRECSLTTVEIVLEPADRTLLHDHIAARFSDMLERGLVDELCVLRRRYTLDRELPSMRAVGYRQAWAYLEGETSHAQMADAAVVATRQLARRQLTWLRRSSQGVRIDPGDPRLLDKVLNQLRKLGC